MNITLYFGGSSLVLTEANPQHTQNERIKQSENFSELTLMLEKLVKSKASKNFSLVVPNLKAASAFLKSHFFFIEAAGGLIENSERFLFIKRLGLWDLPKGKMEKGEDSRQCAVRECEEECGVQNLSISKELAPTYHVYPYKSGFALKQSNWYYMTTDYNKALTPQTEENITEVVWFSRQEITTTVLPNTYLTIRDVIKEALAL